MSVIDESVKSYPQAQQPVEQYSEAGTYEVSSPAPRDVWLDLYCNSPGALPSQSPEWVDCICSFSAYEDASRLYTFADGQQLLMPAVKRKGWPTPLSVQASFPHAWSVGGVLSQRTLTVKDLQVVFADLAKTPFLAMSIFPDPYQGDLWKAAQPPHVTTIPRRAHYLELEGGFDKVWRERFESKTRNKIRKAEKLGVEIERDTTGKLLGEFEELFQRSLDRWAKQQNEPRWLAHLRAELRDPRSKTEHIMRTMNGKCQIWIARHNGEAVAAALELVDRNIDGLRGASIKELAAPVNANDLLKKAIIESACARGCQFYHMGESGWSEGISRFKERLGARPFLYQEYRLERFPLTKLDQGLRRMVKRVIGFKDN